jgi:hypothetical protein
VLGVVLEPELPEPLEPPMFGQFTLDPECVRGVPAPPEGAVVLGADEGAGLAAETAATPPPTSSNPETTAVRTARRRPAGFDCAVAASRSGGCAGSSGW